MSDEAPQAAITHGVPPGRPVVLTPTPPGLWMVLLGLAVGALAPLFGFLIGGALGSAEEAANDPMFIALFAGILVGGVGVLIAIAGGMRLWRHSRDQRLEEDAQPAAGATRARRASDV